MARPRVHVAAAGLLALAVLALLFVVYLRLSRTVVVGSDGATIALQGWDMLHGNVLLHGWATSDVSFYTTELPEYMLLERLSGLGPDVVHIAGALTYTIIVLLACLAARGRAGLAANGRAGSVPGGEGLVRVLIAGGIMLSPAPGFGASTLLLAPDHLGSAVPVLLAWLAVDRCERRWYVPVVAGLILAWGLVADPLIEITGVAPMVVIGGIRAAQRARHREPWWFEAGLALAAIAASGLAAVVSMLIRAAGGFVVSPVDSGFAGFTSLGHNAFLAGQGLLLLFGATFVTGQPVNMVLSVLHLVSVVMVLAALIVALRRLFRPACRDELLAPLLAVAIAANIAFYVASRYPTDLLGTREVSAVLPFGAVLAGRVLARPVLKALNARPSRLPLPLARVPAGGVSAGAVSVGAVLAGAVLAGAAGAVLAGYGASLGAYASLPVMPAEHEDLAGWLVANHLRSGLTPDYWLANITTVDSGGRARVAWVTDAGGSVTAPPPWHVQTQWYLPAGNSANFLVTDTAPGSAAWRSAVADARLTFGPPASIRSYRQYTIMIWNRNVLGFLR